jgi:hypothetical protein
MEIRKPKKKRGKKKKKNLVWWFLLVLVFFLFFKNPGLIGDADDSVYNLKINHSFFLKNYYYFDFAVFVLGTL